MYVKEKDDGVIETFNVETEHGDHEVCVKSELEESREHQVLTMFCDTSLDGEHVTKEKVGGIDDMNIHEQEIKVKTEPVDDMGLGHNVDELMNICDINYEAVRFGDLHF